MRPITIRIDEDTHRILSDEADERGVSVSAVAREKIERGMDYEEIKRERDRLRAEKRTLINDREERTELLEYVERDLEADQRREERRQAPAWRRAKWWLLGEPSPDREQDT